MQVPLTLATLGDLADGAARIIIDAAIRDAIADLEDRGQEDEKPRKAVITLTFSMLDNGMVDTKVEAVTKAPARRTPATIGNIRVEGGKAKMIFSQYAPEDPHQRTIDEYEPRGMGDSE